MKKDNRIWIFIWVVMIITIVLLVVFYGKKKDKQVENGQNTEQVQTTKNDKTETKTDTTASTEYVKVEKDGTKVNTSEKFASTKTLNGLEISNISLKEKGNITEITASVKNTTDKDIDGQFVSLKFLDKEGKTIVILGSYIPEVKANSTATLNTNSTGDFSNAYDFEISKSEE